MPSLAELRPLQPRAVETLANALASGRLHHAYAFVAQRPAIANDLADAVAQVLVCATPVEGSGCGTCAPCRKLAGGNHPDVTVIAPNEKDKITIDVIRDASARLGLKAVEAATKVVIVRGADTMNPAAQNALLKTLEEPPGPTCFLLAVTRFRALLPTVRSRCQRVRLQPPEREGAAEALAAAGIPAQLTGPLAALVGPDVDAAQGLVEAGAPEVLATLRRVLAGDPSAAAVVEASTDLGSDAGRFDLALALLEVELRDRLAARHRDPAPPPAPGLAQAVDRLMRQRRVRALNPNRALSLESVLLPLAGLLAQRPPIG